MMAASAAVVLGLSGCTDAEMAQVNEDIAQASNDNANMVQMERDCKNYLGEKIPISSYGSIFCTPRIWK